MGRGFWAGQGVSQAQKWFLDGAPAAAQVYYDRAGCFVVGFEANYNETYWPYAAPA